MKQISEGNWSVGKVGSVVSDTTPSWYKGGSGHDDNNYYGGFLIAESIANVEDAKVIAAAPDLLKACKQLIDSPHQEHFGARLNDEEMKGIEMIKAAILKATTI
jgi:hypothetical protein